MNRNRKNRNLIQERLTILMVVLFCILISGSERFVQFGSAEDKVEKTADNSRDGETFVGIAVDAVVPFATTVVQTAFYFIYEIIGFEAEVTTHDEEVSRYPSHFFGNPAHQDHFPQRPLNLFLLRIL